MATCAATQKEIDRRKRSVDRLASQGRVSAAQAELDRFTAWFEATGEPRLAAALEELQAIHGEMQDQDIDQDIQAEWAVGVSTRCGQRY